MTALEADKQVSSEAVTKPKGAGKKAAAKPSAGSSAREADADADDADEKSYWLLKAEPEPRFENGTDVSFSIDDLAARTEPEAWDGT